MKERKKKAAKKYRKPAMDFMPGIACPEWHRRPLRLTAEEIRHPRRVLRAFFALTTLPDARHQLQMWLLDAVNYDTDTNGATISLYNDIVRMVEAAWLLCGGLEAVA